MGRELHPAWFLVRRRGRTVDKPEDQAQQNETKYRNAYPIMGRRQQLIGCRYGLAFAGSIDDAGHTLTVEQLEQDEQCNNPMQSDLIK